MSGAKRRMNGAMWWLDRWRKSTAYTDMSAEEQGLYRNLCDEVWLRPDGIIPTDSLAKASGDPVAWGRSGEKVLRWMRREGPGWTNDTALEVRRQSEDLKQKRSKSGSKGGSKTAANMKANVQPKTKPPSPSPSPEQGFDGGGNGGPKANPMITDRPALEAECRSLIEAQHGAEDPVEYLARHSLYKGGSKLNYTTMTDDRLLQTVRRMREEARQRASDSGRSGRWPVSGEASDEILGYLDRMGAVTSGDRLGDLARMFLKQHPEGSPEAWARFSETTSAPSLITWPLMVVRVAQALKERD